MRGLVGILQLLPLRVQTEAGEDVEVDLPVLCPLGVVCTVYADPFPSARIGVENRFR